MLSVTLALMLLANDPHGAEHLKDLLAGQLLWTGFEYLLIPLILSVFVLLISFSGYAKNNASLFYVLFAISVTTSVQLVGVYLVFASLIIPALACKTMNTLLPAYLIGFSGYLLGLISSFYFDLPTGPAVVWSMAIVALLFKILQWSGSRDHCSIAKLR